MTDQVLTREQVLDAAEEVLRRYGPAKATVVDVARALGVSHGSVYRHFPSKAALRDAVTERWLKRASGPLEAIVAEDRPAPERLRRWFDALLAIKRAKVRAEPEMFATYEALVEEFRDSVTRHLETLADHVTRIIADGVESGEFVSRDARASAWAVLNATSRFHNPVHALEWKEPGIDDAFEGVWDLIVSGLRARDGSDARPLSGRES